MRLLSHPNFVNFPIDDEPLFKQGFRFKINSKSENLICFFFSSRSALKLLKSTYIPIFFI